MQSSLQDDEEANSLNELEVTETKKKKRRRKNRKKNKAGAVEESEEELENTQTSLIHSARDTFKESQHMNLEVVGDNAPPEQLNNCISRLSDQDFDKQMAEYSQRL